MLVQLLHVAPMGHMMFQSLNFTGMGGPMGVYEPFDTDVCDTGGLRCVPHDNEGFYGADASGGSGGNGGAGGPHGPTSKGNGRGGRGGSKKSAGSGKAACPPAFDCNGINPKYWHKFDGVMDEYW